MQQFIDEGVRKIAAHQITASDLNTFTITSPDNMRMKSVMTTTRCWFKTSKSGDELISVKETFGVCEGRAKQHYNIPVRATSSTCVFAHTTVTSRGCQHFPLLSALWLVGDSDAVSLRCVWTRDRMMSFYEKFSCSSSVVHPVVNLVFSWLLHVHFLDIRTSQAMDRSRRHHTLQFTVMSHRS